MKLEKISEKQAQILDFVVSGGTYLICDGAVRSGKTVFMSMGFVLWAMEYFDRTNFGICGKTVQSAERNVVKPLLSNESLPYTMRYRVSEKMLTVRCGSKENYFYIFGGKDESSYTLIQGITLAGVLLDEVALMPRSFVEQALSRAISYANRKYWFNCNPAGPGHWFYKEWILPVRSDVTHLHFSLEDNPILTREMIEATKALYSGVFYRRYILGQWCIAEGLVYEFDKSKHTTKEIPDYGQYYISCDYGTLNPFSAGLWCYDGKKAVRIREFYYDGRAKMRMKTDEEYYEDLERLAGDLPVERVIVDPSAASFIETIRRHGRFSVRKAKNEVLDGIHLTARMLQSGSILIHESCEDAIREFGLYAWDEKVSFDRPIKANDHAMDDIRYFCATVMRRLWGKDDD